jgi:DNA-binding response OmpR family regulator
MMSGKKNGNIGGQTGTPCQRQAGAPQRILVVEDEAGIRRLNVEILKQAGYHADAAENGAVAWEVLQLRNYDLLVTDNNMPKVTGLELLQKLHDAHIAIPVIMATGILPREEVIRHPRLQIHATLVKPYSIEELLATVKSILNMYAANDAGGQGAPPPNWRPQSLTDAPLLL